MKGPIEKMADIAIEANEVANDNSTKDEGKARANDISQAATEFVANKANCCEGDIWKPDLPNDGAVACSALGDPATVCAAQGEETE